MYDSDFCQKWRPLFLTKLWSRDWCNLLIARLQSRIYGLGKGSVFTANDFLDIGGRAAVDKALSRLSARGVIRRLARGPTNIRENTQN